MQEIRKLVAEDFEAVNQRICDQLYSRVELVEDIGQYITEAGGKRLRPLLALLAAKACNYQGKDQIDLAVIIEFIHTATLLHDDVVDLSMLRRGRPTANAQWGDASSILVGDFIYSRAFQMLVALGSMEIMALFSDTTNQLAEGEVFQLTKAGDPDTTTEDYLQIITDKTAILFAAALKGAGILSKASSEELDALHSYGIDLGIAFQLADDALDYEGDAKLMGKNLGDDLAEGKPTLPLIYTMANGSDDDAELIRQAISNKDASNIETIVATVKKYDGLNHTKALAQHHSELAKDRLKVIPDSQYKDALAALADFATQRSF